MKTAGKTQTLRSTLYMASVDSNGVIEVSRITGGDPTECVAVIAAAGAATHIMRNFYRAIVLGHGNAYMAGLVDAARFVVPANENGSHRGG